ncbi:CotH kinase family protein [Parabacteroides sp. PF5-9]|uniref:CotH kinase family protein n=1 Tax=Parabacteroides sp. PF5-9 TaxID=1742404 RepID=UPI0024738389|nr:CotH kinase family protein [Parabacteroides sp. PF5-9]MDH6357331.1 hypothetical protein [Parabacteroides sp. PF5-9]
MKRQLFFLFLSICFSMPFSSAKVWINEFMQSNIDYLVDDLNEFPDSWVELYNDSSQPVDIKGWNISDQAIFPSGWEIKESTIIPAQGYLMIYCDKVEAGLHTSFRLESGKNGVIYLYNAKGELEDEVVDIPKQPAPNIARGRIEDGIEEWAYFVTPTAGHKNKGAIADVLLPSPVFSLRGGVYKQEVSVSLLLPEDIPDGITEADIRYTTDGSEPTVESIPYTGSITLTEPTSIRAKIIAPGYLINRSAVQSYIITDRELTLPIISLSLDPTFLWDDDLGIYTEGKDKENPNYSQDWRRPVHFEYFTSEDEGSVLNQLEEMRTSGGYSRMYPQKSLILYANKRFGQKRYDYPLFKDKPDQEIKSFMIRNSGNDFYNTHFRDAAIQLFMGEKVDLDYQAYQPAILFINGQYFGIQNLRERSNDDFVIANYDGLENIDMIENWAGAISEVKAGDRLALNDMVAKLLLPSDQVPYDEIMDMVDLDEFINYMILQIYVANTDFPHGNVVLWRPKTDEGKWRFIVKDTDLGLGYAQAPDYNALAYNTDTTQMKYFKILFTSLLSQDVFKKKFYSAFAVYMGDILHYDATSHVIDSIQQLIAPEMTYHRQRWPLRDMDYWESEVARMKKWCLDRNSYMYEHLREHFGLKGLTPVKLTIPKALKASGIVSINDVPLFYSSFNGQYFTGETLKIKWEGEEPETIGWRITATVGGQTFTREFATREVEYLIPENCTDLVIVADQEIDGIQPVEDFAIQVMIDNHRLVVSGMTAPSSIYVYDAVGRLSVEKRTDQPTVSIPLQYKGAMFVRIVDNQNRIVTRKVVHKL